MLFNALYQDFVFIVRGHNSTCLQFSGYSSLPFFCFPVRSFGSSFACCSVLWLVLYGFQTLSQWCWRTTQSTCWPRWWSLSSGSCQNLCWPMNSSTTSLGDQVRDLPFAVHRSCEWNSLQQNSSFRNVKFHTGSGNFILVIDCTGDVVNG